MSTKSVSLRIDAEILNYLEARAEAEHRTLTNMIVHIICQNGCTGCPNFTKENGIRFCNGKEISGFVCSKDTNPIPKWCPLMSDEK
jgi:hypothetical protein